MSEVEVLVQVYDRGQTKRTVVQVEETCFGPEGCCWRTVAAAQAAAVLGLPFMDVAERAKYGLHPEDKTRLAARYSRGEVQHAKRD